MASTYRNFREKAHCLAYSFRQCAYQSASEYVIAGVSHRTEEYQGREEREFAKMREHGAFSCFSNHLGRRAPPLL